MATHCLATHCLAALCVRFDGDGNARMSWAGYLLCAATAVLVLVVGWWALFVHK